MTQEMIMGGLTGKVALITGSSRGIGRAIAKRFAAEGASVVMSASRLGAHGNLKGTLEDAVEEISEAGGKAAAEVADLGNMENRRDLIARAQRHFGAIDILVNNAAVAKMTFPSMATCEERNWMFDVNVNAPIDLAQQALPAMRKRHQGWILNISSATTSQPVVPYPDSTAAAHAIGPYGASKAALDRYTQALAHEVSGEGVFINTLAPESIVFTNVDKHVRAIGLKNPKMVEPVEMMAEAALALCSQQITGQVCFSRRLLHMLGLPLKSLDGKTLIGDAFTEADLESEGC
jgi:citronellol/citronellal dehydrogenase